MNKKRVFLSVLILSAIIIALYGIGHLSFSVKESEDTRPGETDIVAGEKVSSEYSYEKKENATENRMPKIVDIIIIDGYHSALCADGTVWCWTGKQKAAAKQMSGLKDIKKITAAYVGIREWFMTDAPTGMENCVLYALSEDGYVYAWGYNNPCLISTEREDWFRVFDEPVRLDGLSDIVDMDARNGKAFAVDKEGTFYVWGDWEIGWVDNTIPACFPEDRRTLVEGVTTLCAGAGDYSYFVREDGTVFSIMQIYCLLGDGLMPVLPYIFPSFEHWGDSPDIHRDKEYAEKEQADMEKRSAYVWEVRRGAEAFLEDTVDLSEGSKTMRILLYELGSCGNVELIASDGYTMYVYKSDNTLWYWNSNRIRFHDDYMAMCDGETGLVDYTGCFEQVDIENLTHSRRDGKETPCRLVDICAAEEHVLFLTDDGQVFMSGYETCDRLVDGLMTSELKFRALKAEDIVSVNTDGRYGFSAVNRQGEYLSLDMTPWDYREFYEE